MNVGLKFLARLGAIPPQAWDAIIPHGPVWGGVHRRVESVALNPQPLPPHETVVGAAQLDRLLTSAIIVVGGREGSGAEHLLREIDDWCGTGWPRKWPRPRPPKAGWDESLVFTGAALAAASLADQYDHDEEMQGALVKAAEQLAAAAEAG